MLEVIDIHKQYEGKPLLSGVSFRVEEGELVCLLGASGSGKSTLLRIIGGLEDPESGRVIWNGEDITQTPAHLRGFGLMFQDYALFPNRTVEQNVSFGLEIKLVPPKEREAIVMQQLELVRMQAFARRPVTELSGGEQQRVALARALAPDPHLLMLDEPLGALDHALRVQLIAEIRRILKASRKPALYVTHDREEAFALADRLVVLHDGLVIQQGSPRELFDQPASPWLAAFLGLGNLIPGTVLSTEPFKVRTQLGDLQISEPKSFQTDEDCFLLLRPNNAEIEPSTADNAVSGIVRESIFMGEYYQLILIVKDQPFEVRSERDYAVGESVQVRFDPQKIQCLAMEKSLDEKR